MSKRSNATCIVQAVRPGTLAPGPSSAIRYDVRVQPDTGGYFNLIEVRSDLVSWPDSVACVGSPVGSEHQARVVAGRVTLWIPSHPTFVDCEDIE